MFDEEYERLIKGKQAAEDAVVRAQAANNVTWKALSAAQHEKLRWIREWELHVSMITKA